MQTDLRNEDLVAVVGDAIFDPTTWKGLIGELGEAYTMSPKDLKSVNDPYDVLLAYGVDKKQIKFSKQESKELTKYIKELSKLTREQEKSHQLIIKAASELQTVDPLAKPRDFVNVLGERTINTWVDPLAKPRDFVNPFAPTYPKLYEIYNGWRKGEIGRDEYMERLRELGRWQVHIPEPNQLPDNIRSGIRNYTDTIKENKRAMLDHEVTAFLEPTFTALETVPLPNINVSQNIINRMVAEAKDREFKEVSFLIGNDTPDSQKYISGLGRSEEVKKNYKTTIAGQVIATAKKIGGTHSWNKEGYLTITLPEKEFTLPMFKNQGGKVIGSLQRTRRAKGGYI
jgi:hypothetical protein